MGKKVIQADIAHKLGVSIVSVSKALSGKDGVGRELRKKIIETAEEMGYSPSEAGLERAQDREFNISILVHEMHMTKYGSFYSQMNQLVSMNIQSVGSYAFTELVTSQMERDRVLPPQVAEGKVDGIIIIGNLKRPYMEFLIDTIDVPFVCLDFYESGYPTDYIISDSFYGGYLMTRYLISLGHKRIAYVGTVNATGSIMDRYLGYVKALRDAGIEPKDEWIIPDRYEDSGRVLIPEDFELRYPLPTAFFCNCDITAGRLIKRLKADGRRVPEDYSVAGYDNYIYPGSCDVRITTYEVNAPGMAKKAVSTLLKKLNGRSEPPMIYIVSGHLVEKDSVKRIGK